MSLKQLFAFGAVLTLSTALFAGASAFADDTMMDEISSEEVVAVDNASDEVATTDTTDAATDDQLLTEITQICRDSASEEGLSATETPSFVETCVSDSLSEADPENDSAVAEADDSEMIEE